MRRRTGLLMWLTLEAAIAAPAAAQVETVEDLKQLFETDPGEGFLAAARMFEQPKTNGDLDGMMEIIQVVGEASGRCHYPWPRQNMRAAAARVAEELGKWEMAGRLYAAAAGDRTNPLAGVFLASPAPSDRCQWRWLWLRAARLMRLAEAAYAKAGKDNPQHERLMEIEKKLPALEASAEKWRSEMVGPRYALRIDTIERAAGEGLDAEAISSVQHLIQDVSREPDDSLWNAAVRYAMYMIPVQGGDRLLPVFRGAITEGGRAGRTVSQSLFIYMMQLCAMTWPGRDDAFRDAFYWALGMVDERRTSPPVGLGIFTEQLRCFGRVSEAHWLTDWFLQWQLLPRWKGTPYCAAASHYIAPHTPQDLRRLLVRWTCRHHLEYWDRPFKGPKDLINHLTEAVAEAPPGQQSVWAFETGMQLLETAVQYPQAQERVNAMAGAAQFLEDGGRDHLAEQVRLLSQELTQGDPGALLQCALMTAQSAAAEGRWQDVVNALQPGLVAHEPSVPALQAYVLLAQAKLELGEVRDGGAWLNRACDVLDQVDVPVGERVNYLVNIASLTDDQAQQVSLLQRAQQICREAGLALMAEKITDQLAQAALEEGHLAAAEQALVDIINRNEQKRERLAFDPLLRQQWFADNITPYRKLLRVAALKKDPYLALSCAERMRSRVLTDQLSWQKVDMSVRLEPEVAERLSQLRQRRQEAYALLERVVGGATEASTEVWRGLYMPIRGLYMPIRGPLEGEPASAADVEGLKQLLADLARDEAALESAVRERVPAYAMASNVRIPSGQELAEAIAQDPELAVVEYTFSDEGLVVVALRGGKDPKVVLTSKEESDALFEQIGDFREAIWERKEEAYEQARELYKVLVSPVEGMLRGAERVWIMAEGGLQLVPFAALIDRRNQYLGTRTALAYAPSLTLALSSRGERPASERAAVIVAAPDTGAPDIADAVIAGGGRGLYMPIRGLYMPIRGEGGVSLALTNMSMVPLPGAKAEGEAIAQCFDECLLLTDKEATKESLWQEGGSCDILHIATHGFADPDVPELSGLLLAGGDEEPYEVLRAVDVYSWPLAARLVTLSACQTALGQDVQGEGIVGLARAFIYAGARDVVCSLWPVSDESTATLMTAFYEALAKGATVEQALQQAQSALPQTGENSHPFYWAGFVAVRGPA